MKYDKKKKELAGKSKGSHKKKEIIELGDDRHPDTIAYERRLKKYPRYSRPGVTGFQY